MFIIYGLRSSLFKNKYKLDQQPCPNCHQEDTLIACTKGNYIHIFFIPIAPTHKTIYACCTHCKAEIPKSIFTQKMQQILTNKLAKYPNKRPLWHGLGCLTIVALTVIVFLIVIINILIKM